jgi:drug/metabolite transporter (DMT)-like permease
LSAHKTTLLATAKLFVTAAIWASTYVLARILVREIGPISLGGLRFFTAGLFLVIYLKYSKFDFSTLKGHWFKLCALGVLSFSIGNGCTYFALQSLPSTTVSFLTSFVTPLVLIMGITAALSSLWQEPLYIFIRSRSRSAIRDFSCWRSAFSDLPGIPRWGVPWRATARSIFWRKPLFLYSLEAALL